ncbi:NUDIX hydrolase [Paenibacillus turpanensis]|uniref:NUDIX hydrolase n=1 Tax=Paenibacillus turpanensis TaxID=2689078 RepID=UPI00140DFAE8|nr:NUDIX hydrolase [Paenibacillus turpanensis]
MVEKKYHRHLGIYGVCTRKEKLLVIRKNGGPYSGRYDMPGGSIEPNETILNALTREFQEETGIVVEVLKNIGTKDFVVPWTRDGYDHTYCHHIVVLYEVEYITGHVDNSPNIDDSLGAVWKDTRELNEENSSPIVMAAKEWIETKNFNFESVEYTEWITKG